MPGMASHNITCTTGTFPGQGLLLNRFLESLPNHFMVDSLCSEYGECEQIQTKGDQHRREHDHYRCLHSSTPTPAGNVHEDYWTTDAATSAPVSTIPPYHRIWITSSVIEGRATPPAQHATQQAGPDFDWRRLHDAEEGGDALPDVKQCFGLTDTEEYELMVWYFGRMSGIVRYDEFRITYQPAPATLLETPAQAHTPRSIPATFPWVKSKTLR